MGRRWLGVPFTRGDVSLLTILLVNQERSEDSRCAGSTGHEERKWKLTAATQVAGIPLALGSAGWRARPGRQIHVCASSVSPESRLALLPCGRR